LVNTALAPWAGRSRESTRQGALSRSRIAPRAVRERFFGCKRIGGSYRPDRFVAAPGLLVSCLGAVIYLLLAPPRGSAAAGDRLGVLPGGAPAPLGALWGKGARAGGGGKSRLLGMYHVCARCRWLVTPPGQACQAWRCRLFIEEAALVTSTAST
jgi:hypothetical protein